MLATIAPLASSVAVRTTIRLRFANAVTSGSSVSGRCAGASKSAHHVSVAARCASGAPRAPAQQLVGLVARAADGDVKVAVATPLAEVQAARERGVRLAGGDRRAASAAVLRVGVGALGP